MHTYTVVYNMFKNTSCVSLFLFGPFNACVNFEELPKNKLRNKNDVIHWFNQRRITIKAKTDNKGSECDL